MKEIHRKIMSNKTKISVADIDRLVRECAYDILVEQAGGDIVMGKGIGAGYEYESCPECGSHNWHSQDTDVGEVTSYCEDCGHEEIESITAGISPPTQADMNMSAPTETLSDGTLVVDTDDDQSNRDALYDIKNFADFMYNGMNDPLYKVVSGYLVIEDLEYIKGEIDGYQPIYPEDRNDPEWMEKVYMAQEAINNLVDRYRPVIDSLNNNQSMNEQPLPPDLSYEEDDFGQEEEVDEYDTDMYFDDLAAPDDEDLAPYRGMNEQPLPPDLSYEEDDFGQEEDEVDEYDTDMYFNDLSAPDDDDLAPYRGMNEQEDVGGYVSYYNFGNNSNPDIYAESPEMMSDANMSESDHMYEVIAYNHMIGCDPVGMVEGLQKVGLDRDIASDKVRSLIAGAEIVVRDGLTEEKANKIRNVIKSYGFDAMVYRPSSLPQIPLSNFHVPFKGF
jgi:hypothetical protein